MREEERLLTPEQVADRLSVSRYTVMKWLRDGKIAGRKLGGKIWRVHPDDVQAFIDASARQPSQGEDIDTPGPAS